MKKILSILFLVTITNIFGQVGMNVMSTMSRPPIFGSSPFQDSLWAVDTTSYSIRYRSAPSLVGFTITGMTGLTTHPHTGEIYIIMKLSGVSGRVLGKFNPLTGQCTQVGNLGDNFSTISFREDGQLFGVTGDGATVPETMYLIDHTNGTKTLAATLGAGADGEIIAYNYDDGFFYHWSGNSTVVMERVMSTLPYTPTNIPVTGPTNGETFGSVYLGNGTFLNSNISSRFVKVSSLGVYGSQLGSNPDDLRGLALVLRWVDRPGAQDLCAGDSALLEAFGSAGGAGRYKFQWVKDGVNIPGATSSSYYATQSGWYNCRMILDSLYTNGQTMDSAITIYTDTAWYGRRVNINPASGLNPNPTAYICSVGDSVALTNSYSGINNWYMNGVLIPGETNDTLWVNTVSASYNVEATLVSGCFDTAAVATQVILAPTYTVSPNGTDTVCSSGALVSVAAGADTYQWLLNGGTIGGATNNSYNATANGTYTCITDIGGCIDTTNTSMIFSIAPNFVQTPTGLDSVCIGGSELLTATSGAQSYQWLLNGSVISGATTNTYTATATGLYSCITTFGSCADTTASFQLNIIACTSIDEEESFSMTIYPNPAETTIEILSNNTINHIQIVDLTGRVIIKMNNPSSSKINVQSLPSGVYIINAKTDKGIYSRRFIKK